MMKMRKHKSNYRLDEPLQKLLLVGLRVVVTLTVIWVLSAADSVSELSYQEKSVQQWYSYDIRNWCAGSKTDDRENKIPFHIRQLYEKPIVKKGVYQARWTPFKSPDKIETAKWILEKDESTVPDEEVLKEILPVHDLDITKIANPPEGSIQVTWFGHASVLVQFDGISVLADPIFSKKPSPLQQKHIGPGLNIPIMPFLPKDRFRPVPGGSVKNAIEALPRNLNAVIISHSHHDHLDKDTVDELNKQFDDKLYWFVPMGLKKWMEENGCKRVTEMTWWQSESIPEYKNIESTNHVTFYFTPAQHWSMRNPMTDTNKVLWGSWVIKSNPSSQRNSKGYSFFFGGDTAYCDAFKLIGQQLGPFDLAAIPIGAYHPRWFMYHQHVDPMDAIRIHKDLQATKSFAIHWGTFSLANEFYLEPMIELNKRASEACLEENEFIIINHGKTLYFIKQD